MYYQLSPKGIQYKSGELPRWIERALIVFEPNTPAETSQVARAIRVPKVDTETYLTYLAEQGYLNVIEAPPKPKTVVKPKGLGLHMKTIKELAEQEERKGRSKQRWAHSKKGQKSRRKYELGKGKLAKSNYQKSPKGKAAYERWRCKIKLTPKGLARLQETEWTPEHDLLAYIHLEKPTKQQLTEQDFELLRKNNYI